MGQGPPGLEIPMQCQKGPAMCPPAPCCGVVPAAPPGMGTQCVSHSPPLPASSSVSHPLNGETNTRAHIS